MKVPSGTVVDTLQFSDFLQITFFQLNKILVYQGQLFERKK